MKNGGACAPALVLALAAALLFAPAARAAVSVTMKVQPQEVYLGEAAELTVTVSGTMDAGEPSLENMGDFTIRGGGSSSNISIINGSFSRSKSWSYQLIPRRTGDFTLGPASVSADGIQQRSNTVRLTVSKAPESAGGEGSGPVFANAGLSTEMAYPGQEVIYKISLYHSEPLADRVSLSLPEVPGLSFTPLSEPANHTAVIKGVRYGLIEAAYAVSAAKPGEYEIPPARMDVPVVLQSQQRRGNFPGFPSIDALGFSWRQNRVIPVYTKAFPLTVLPFPEEGRPADFGGLVGRFSLSAQVSPAKIRANESATLTVKITGQGNVRAIPDLDLPRPGDLKVYPDKPLFEEKPGSDGTIGEKVMKWALVPQSAGNIEIPSLSLSYFEPGTGYKTLSSPVLSLAVEPGGEPPAPAAVQAGAAGPVAKKQVEVLGQDIQTIHESLGGLAPAAERRPGSVLIAVLALPVLIWLGCLLGRRLSHRSEGLARTLGARKALPALEKGLRSLPDDDAEGVWKACCAYVHARLLLPGAGLTPAEAAGKLKDAGAEPEDAERFGALLAGLEARVFAAGAGAPMQKEKEEILALLRKMEKKLP